MASVLTLGNTAPVDTSRDGADGVARVSRPDLGNRLTTVSVPDDTPPSEVLSAVRSLWPYHSDADGPEWVESDDDGLASLVAREFTVGDHECRVGRPRGWKEG